MRSLALTWAIFHFVALALGANSANELVIERSWGRKTLQVFRQFEFSPSSPAMTPFCRFTIEENGRTTELRIRYPFEPTDALYLEDGSLALAGIRQVVRANQARLLPVLIIRRSNHPQEPWVESFAPAAALASDSTNVLLYENEGAVHVAAQGETGTDPQLLRGSGPTYVYESTDPSHLEQCDARLLRLLEEIPESGASMHPP